MSLRKWTSLLSAVGGAGAGAVLARMHASRHLQRGPTSDNRLAGAQAYPAAEGAEMRDADEPSQSRLGDPLGHETHPKPDLDELVSDEYREEPPHIHIQGIDEIP